MSSNLPAFRSAFEIPTPSLDREVLLPRYALLKADVTLAKSLPVEAEMSNERLRSCCALLESRVATASV
jgi:hypothetical protein